MNTHIHNNVGASQEAVAAPKFDLYDEVLKIADSAAVDQGTSNTTFAAKAKKVAGKAKVMAEKAVFPVIATACTVSAVACATYRIVKLVRLIKGDEK